MRFSHTLQTIMSDGDYKQNVAYHIWQRWGSSWLRMNCFPWETLSPSCTHTWHCDGSTHFLSTSSKTCPEGSKQTESGNECELLIYLRVYVNWRYLVGRQHGIPPHMWRDSSEAQGAGRWEGKRFHRRYISTHTPPLHPYSTPHSSMLQVNRPLQHCYTMWLKG